MSEIHVGDTVRVTHSRLAIAASPYHDLYAELWRKYGHREGKVIGIVSHSVHRICDTRAAVIKLEDGDTVAWETHLLTKTGV